MLVRLALRRDRVLLPVWTAVFVLVAGSSASATIGLYPTLASREQAAAGINTVPALVALYGRIYDPTSLGSLAMFKLSAFGAVMVAVLGIVTVTRHTRAEEEAGRLELVGATVVGRLASLTAALAVCLGTNVVLGLFTAGSLRAAGLPMDGALAFGAAWASVGVVFGAVAALTAQLSRTARSATGLALLVLGAAYLLRAAGDASGGTQPMWLSWLSPIGWGQQVRPFAGDRWWVLSILLLCTLALAGAAYALAVRRDLGAGLLSDRPGPAAGATLLRSPLALAWRLQRGNLLAWASAFLVLGGVLGGIADNVARLLDSPESRQMITRLGGTKGLTDAFLAAELGFVGVIASAYGIQAALHLRDEETSLRAEPVLATAVGRVRWAVSHVALALGGLTVLLAVAGLAAGLAHALAVRDATQVWRVVGAALVHLPAAAVLTGIVVAAFGLAPRFVAAGWAALALFVLLAEIGPLLQLDQRLLDVSPFAHVPKLPGATLQVTPLLWLAALAAALIGVGLVGFRRRDVG